MQNAINYSDILNTINTKDDFNSLVKELETLGNSIYDLKSKNVKYSGFISEALKVDTKENIIKNIKQELTKVKFMEIVLVSYPSSDLLTKIFERLKNTSQKIAIDIKIDQKIMAGACISFQGKFYDGSYRKLLTKYV